MKKGVVFLMVFLVAAQAWCGGSGEPKPAPAPSPTIVSTILRVYTRSASAGWSNAVLVVLVPVSTWSDGHREFAGQPSVDLHLTPVSPYLIEVPKYSSTNVRADKLVNVANYVRAFQRVVVGTSAQTDPFFSWPVMQVQPYTFVISP